MKQARQHRRASGSQKQKGAVLLVALIFLIVLTLIGLSAMDTTINQTRMATNVQEKNYALQAAEAGLGWGRTCFTETNLPTTMTPAGCRPGDALFMTRDATQISQATGIRAEYKGTFPPPRGGIGRGRAGGGWTATGASVAYFEARSAGENLTDSGMSINVRGGFRQLAPAAN